MGSEGLIVALAVLGGVSLLLYLGITLAVQRACLNERARRRPWLVAPRPSGT